MKNTAIWKQFLAVEPIPVVDPTPPIPIPILLEVIPIPIPIPVKKRNYNISSRHRPQILRAAPEHVIREERE